LRHDRSAGPKWSTSAAAAAGQQVRNSPHFGSVYEPMPRSRTNRAKPKATLRTILFVEPDILVRMVVADYLRECGYAVIEAVSAEDARKVLSQGDRLISSLPKSRCQEIPMASLWPNGFTIIIVM
jgi:hypothetical protein